MKFLLLILLCVPVLVSAEDLTAPGEPKKAAQRVDAQLKKDAKKLKKFFGIKKAEPSKKKQER